MDTMRGVLANDNVEEHDTIMYGSSMHLFINIKKSIDRCTSFSTTKALYDLTNCFKNIFW